LAAIWDIRRIGSAVQDTIERTIRHCVYKDEIYRKGKFLYSQPIFKAQYVRKPNEWKPETLREPDFISEEEMELALILITKSAMSIEKELLFIETARLFGWERNTSRVEAGISKAFNKLIKDEKLKLNNELVSLVA